MKIDLSILTKVNRIESFGLQFVPNGRAMIVLKSNYIAKKLGIDRKTNITEKALAILREDVVREVSIVATDDFIKLLRQKYAVQFPPATGKMPLNKLIEIARDYRIMNTTSQRQRGITLHAELFNKRVLDGRKLVAHYGTEITEKVETEIRRHCNLSEEVEFRENENGVMVFVPGVEKITLKVDLFAILASLGMDIVDAVSIDEAVKLYKIKSPKMVVLGDLSTNVETKELFLTLDAWDPFLKKINFEESPASHRAAETAHIEKVYNGSYQAIIEAVTRTKDPIPLEIKESLRNSFTKLSAGWSEKSYIETQYALQQIGRMFNISVQRKQLENIRQSRNRI